MSRPEHRLIDLLVAEHERILAVLGALRDFALHHAHDDPAARPALREFVRFLREYLDGWHHHKEEDLLFEALGHVGFPRDHGPLGCMLHEHQLGRGLVGALAELSGGEDAFSEVERALLADLVHRHVQLLGAHIAKENQVLFPMARRMLPVEATRALDDAAATVAAQRAEHGRELEDLGEALVARYRAARVASGR